MSFGIGQNQQLSDHAFTVTGYAYQLDTIFKDRATPTIITANAPSSLSWKTRLSAIGTGRCPTQYNDQAEAGPPGYGHTRYVLIGVVPHTLPAEESLKKNRAVRKAVGTELPENIIHPVVNKIPLRVVAQITPEVPRGGLKLYALTDQDSVTQLCNAHVISQDFVFYFSEFRNLATNANERRTGWNEKVLGASVVGLIDNQTWYSQRVSGPSHVCNPEEALVNELRLLIGSFAIDRDSAILDRVKALLDRFVPPTRPVFPILDRFLTSSVDGTSFSAEEADQLSVYIGNKWPRIANASPHLLSHIRKGIQDAHLTISYHEAYPFIALACKKLSTDTKEIKDAVTEILDDVKTVSADEGGTVSQPTKGKICVLLAAVTENLRSVSNDTMKTVEELAAIHGNTTVEMPLQVMYESLAHTIDQDELRLLFEQILTYHCFELGNKNRDIAAKLEALSKTLEGLAVLLSRAE